MLSQTTTLKHPDMRTRRGFLSHITDTLLIAVCLPSESIRENKRSMAWTGVRINLGN